MSDLTCTVLVVDDEQHHADGIVESLERLNVKASAVYNGEDALEIFTRDPELCSTRLRWRRSRKCLMQRRRRPASRV